MMPLGPCKMTLFGVERQTPDLQQTLFVSLFLLGGRSGGSVFGTLISNLAFSLIFGII